MAAASAEELIRTLVRDAREGHGWTQGDLVRRLKAVLPADRQSWAKQSNVSKYESGDLGVDLDLHLALLKAVGAPASSAVPKAPHATAPIARPDPLLSAIDETLQQAPEIDRAYLILTLNRIRESLGLPAIQERLLRAGGRRR